MDKNNLMIIDGVRHRFLCQGFDGYGYRHSIITLPDTVFAHILSLYLRFLAWFTSYISVWEGRLYHLNDGDMFPTVSITGFICWQFKLVHKLGRETPMGWREWILGGKDGQK